jgi:hypothetical protein
MKAMYQKLTDLYNFKSNSPKFIQKWINQIIFQKLEGEYLFQKAIRKLTNKQQYLLSYK